MDKVTEYREQARRCREIAISTTSRRVRAALIDLANAWEKLADDREHMFDKPPNTRVKSG